MLTLGPRGARPGGEQILRRPALGHASSDRGRVPPGEHAPGELAAERCEGGIGSLVAEVLWIGFEVKQLRTVAGVAAGLPAAASEHALPHYCAAGPVGHGVGAVLANGFVEPGSRVVAGCRRLIREPPVRAAWTG